MVERMDPDARPDEVGDDAGLQVRKRENQVGSEGEDLGQVGGGEGTA